MKEEYVKLSDVLKAVNNWQNTVGSALNGQLEAYLGVTFGSFNNFHGVGFYMEPEKANRVRLLLGDNHKTMIKVYLAKQE